MSKDHGTVSEVRFKLAAMLRGFTVSKPEGDYAPYDFIVDNGKRLFKVQVKSSNSFESHRPKQMHFNIGKGASTKIAYNAREVDYFAFYLVPFDLFYLIPRSLLDGRLTFKINLNGNKFDTFKENWNLKA